MFLTLERWLLLDRPVIDATACWDRLHEVWSAGGGEEKGSDSSEESASCVSELASQREALLSHILGEDLSPLVAQSFARTVHHVLHDLVDHCLVTASRLSILPVVWHKLKEGGVVLHQSKIRGLLNSVQKSDAVASHIPNDEDSRTLFVELLVYHDLLCGAEGESGHRKYLTELKRHLAAGDDDAVLGLLGRTPSLRLPYKKYDWYLMALELMAEGGYLRKDGGVTLFHKIVLELSRRTDEIDPISALRLRNALTKEFGGQQCLHGSTFTAEMIPVEDRPAEAGELVACRVKLDPSDMTCPVTNVQLCHASMNPSERKHMRDDIFDLARQYEQPTLLEELKRFADWLNAREGPPFNVICDLPNVGQNGLRRVMAQLEATGRSHTALAIVPGRNHIPEADICDVYVVPDGLHDDLFCLLATAVDQKASYRIHGGPYSDRERPLVVTADRYRDHFKAMRNPDFARSWYKHHRWNNESGRDGANVDTVGYRAWRKEDSYTQTQQTQFYNDLLELAQTKTTLVAGLTTFSHWMESRAGHPFTAIIDGANVQFKDQIESMVSRLQAVGENPLVVLPEGVASTMATVSHRLRKQGNLYIAPNCDSYDDIFLMLATVSEQSQPAAHLDLISNDRFLDHRKKLRNPTLFDKWYKKHCFEYSYFAGMAKHSLKKGDRQIESTEWPATDNPSSGMIWHFPIAGVGIHERFALRIPLHCQLKR